MANWKTQNNLLSLMGLKQVIEFLDVYCKEKMPIEANIARKGISGPQSQFPHSCVCERIIQYIPTMGLPFLLEEICGSILGIYKSPTDT
jgi:hypothetical protein